MHIAFMGFPIYCIEDVVEYTHACSTDAGAGPHGGAHGTGAAPTAHQASKVGGCIARKFLLETFLIDKEGCRP